MFAEEKKLPKKNLVTSDKLRDTPVYIHVCFYVFGVLHIASICKIYMDNPKENRKNRYLRTQLLRT